jgi:transposase
VAWCRGALDRQDGPSRRHPKIGNSHARRALVEGAWAYRLKPRVGRHKVDRIEALPKPVREIAWKAQVRLCARDRRLTAPGKSANVVSVAIARERVGFVWALACTVQSPKAA